MVRALKCVNIGNLDVHNCSAIKGTGQYDKLCLLSENSHFIFLITKVVTSL